MQAYIFPYIGYFQLINSVDEFIIYDNIQYTKKGWINRNRILSNGKDKLITVPLKKDSDYLNIFDRELSSNWGNDRKKLLNIIRESYRKALFFDDVYPLIERSLLYEENNLFKFIVNTLEVINGYLGIKTPIVTSSTIEIDHTLTSKEKVIALCKERGADVYVNPIGGVELYSKEAFKNEDLELFFIKSDNIVYEQFKNDFIPWLSIIDVMMFNSKEEINKYLNSYSLI